MLGFLFVTVPETDQQMIGRILLSLAAFAGNIEPAITGPPSRMPEPDCIRVR
jgi:hypothetical protein